MLLDDEEQVRVVHRVVQRHGAVELEVREGRGHADLGESALLGPSVCTNSSKADHYCQFPEQAGKRSHTVPFDEAALKIGRSIARADGSAV